MLQSIVTFLRAGYPEGVPERDYIPLIALLRRRLTDEEVRDVAADLVDRSPDPQDTAAAIAHAIEAVTHESPSEADVDRVRRHLATVGLDIDGARPT